MTGSGFISLPTASASRNRTGSPETTYPAQGRVLTGAKLSVTAAISVTSVVVDVDHPLDSEPVRSATEISSPRHIGHGRFHFSAVRQAAEQTVGIVAGIRGNANVRVVPE